MRTFLAVIGLAGAMSLALAPQMAPAGEPAVAPPLRHDNLAVYFLRGPSAKGPVPLTLKEALIKGHVTVRETDTVERLEIENAGSEAVFVQAGDIVKGGKQDRVLTVSFLVPPKSGPMPIGAYCVEQGRWRARGLERVDRFASSENYLPSRRAKMALAVAALPQAAPPAASAGVRPALPTEQRTANGVSDAMLRNRVEPFGVGGTPRPAAAQRSGQGEVWASVAEAQAKLSANLGADVAAGESRSSLQLALENQKLADRRKGYLAAIEPRAGDGDILGVVFAINGRIVSGELYPSNGLFRKMWPKLAEAAAIEAIGEADGKTANVEKPATLDDVRAFIADADKGKAHVTEIDTRLKRDARDGTKAIAVSTVALDGTVLHRSYVAK